MNLNYEKKKSYSIFSYLFWNASIKCNSAIAFNTFRGYKLNGGVGNYGFTDRYFYVTSSASTLSTMISTAVNSCNYTTASVSVTPPISLVKTTTQPSSVFDVYYDASAFPNDNSTLGITQMYVYSTNVQSPNYTGAPSQNWGWSKIILNPNCFGTLTTEYTNGVSVALAKQGTTAHEFGHAMGLLSSFQCTYVPNEPWKSGFYSIW